MKKEKRYKFTSLGYAQLLLDLRQEKIKKIGTITSTGLIIGLFLLGILGKEMFTVMVCNIGINKVTDWIIG
jgi:hypothetical protein